MKRMIVEKVEVRMHNDRREAGRDAAFMVAARISQLLSEQPQVNIIFAAAPSQNEFLSCLTKCEYIAWNKINAFQLDEYLGLPVGDANSFSHYLDQHLFSHVALRSVHFIGSQWADPAQACLQYAQLLHAFPPDVVCLGIGENGHLAFNDPAVANFQDPLSVKLVELDQVSRAQQVHDGCFASLDLVPTHALTLTIPALLAGRFLFCVVPGASKAKAVYNTLWGPVSTDCPASILRSHNQAILYLDTQSSLLLQANWLEGSQDLPASRTKIGGKNSHKKNRTSD